MSQKTKVLIVDDEPLNVDYIEQRLEDLDYQIITAADGQEALNKIKREQPDLILLDLMMPVLDGFAVLKEIKADNYLRDIPVIIVSAVDDSKSIVKGIKQGADDYITKPIDAERLKKKVREHLG
jgi:putative two-component system response regulator